MPDYTAYNDGALPFGSRVLAIGPNGGNTVNFVAETFDVTAPSDTIERRNEVNEPSGQVTMPGFISGTALIQLANGGVPPDIGDEFLTTYDNTANTKFYLTEVSPVEAQGADKKVNISFRLLINAS